jgi:hypothetical protein
MDEVTGGWRKLRVHNKKLLLATVYMFLHNLLNVLLQIANKMGLQKKLRHADPRKTPSLLFSLMDDCLATAALYRLAPQYFQTGHSLHLPNPHSHH